MITDDIEAVLDRHFGAGASYAIAYALAPTYDDPHWITNISRQDGLRIFDDLILKVETAALVAENVHFLPVAKIGDLTPLCNQVFKVISGYTGRTPCGLIALSLPPAYDYCHWVTNGRHEWAALLLRATVLKMGEQPVHPRKEN